MSNSPAIAIGDKEIEAHNRKPDQHEKTSHRVLDETLGVSDEQPTSCESDGLMLPDLKQGQEIEKDLGTRTYFDLISRSNWYSISSKEILSSVLIRTESMFGDRFTASEFDSAFALLFKKEDIKPSVLGLEM